MLRLLRFAAKVLIVICFPLAALAAAFLKKTRNCTPQELASDLRELADGKYESWDELECVPIEDPRLEAIRQEAMTVALPFRPEDRIKLAALAQRAEEL
jgi:hypothetical protein